MRFLLKLFVLGFFGFAALPAFAPQEFRPEASADTDEGGTPSAIRLASLVGEAAADMRGICDRRPDVCETGGELISYTGERAREGLVIAYAMFRYGHPSMQKQQSGAAESDASGQ